MIKESRDCTRAAHGAPGLKLGAAHRMRELGDLGQVVNLACQFTLVTIGRGMRRTGHQPISVNVAGSIPARYANSQHRKQQMCTNSSNTMQPDTAGHDEQSEHHQAAEPGQNGLSHGLTKAYLNSQEGIHVRTHLKKTLIEIFGDGGCERWQVKKLFEEYDLKNL